MPATVLNRVLSAPAALSLQASELLDHPFVVQQFDPLRGHQRDRRQVEIRLRQRATLVGHPVFSKGLLRPLAREVVADRALAAVALAEFGGLPGDGMDAHRRRPNAHQIDHHLVAFPVSNRLRPTVSPATHRIIDDLYVTPLTRGSSTRPGTMQPCTSSKGNAWLMSSLNNPPHSLRPASGSSSICASTNS